MSVFDFLSGTCLSLCNGICLFAQSLDAIPLEMTENDANARRALLDEMDDDEQDDDIADMDDNCDDVDSKKGVVSVC